MDARRQACEACGAPLRNGLASWHRTCGSCGLESSELSPAIGDDDVAGRIDEDARERALRPIRERNFGHLLGWIRERVGTRAAGTRLKLLDVGCAHGWFAEKAGAHFDTLGIEPDPAIARVAEGRGVEVRVGYFPDALAPGETFDVIVFNDVLEHIPQVVDAMRACRSRLAEGGMLVVNAPDRRGVFYRLSKLLWRMGQRGPFERMWQLGMPSPHLYYFDDASMARAGRAAGLEVRDTRRLPSLVAKGLYARVRFDRRVPLARAIVLYAGALALVPLLRVLPSDISVWFLEPGRNNIHAQDTVAMQATGNK